MIRGSSRTQFFRLGIALLLPITVLAVIGIGSLRNDRLLLLSETKERAERLAADIARSTEAMLLADRSDSPAHIQFVLGSEGQLLTPPQVPSPEPRLFELEQLNPMQQTLWSRARQHEFSDSDPAQ